MDYIIPAWHKLAVDNAVMTPQMHFDDGLSLFQLLNSVDRNAGLILTDYQPHLMALLNRHTIVPDKIESLFDILQGVHHYNSKAFTTEDLQWPTGTTLQYSTFHLVAYLDGRTYGLVVFDEDSRIIYIDLYPTDQEHQRLVVDSRGFVSRCEYYNADGKETERVYFDESGNWRFKHSLINDSVELNPANNYLHLPTHFDHLRDLLKTVLEKQVLQQLADKDRLVVSLDDHSAVSQDVFLPYQSIYYASRWHDCKKAYQQLSFSPKFHCVVDTEQFAKQLPGKEKLVISPLPTQFKLGHSQRHDRQRILLFVENLDPNELATISEVCFQRLMKAKGDDELYLMSYTRQGLDLSNQMIQWLQNNHGEEFQLYDPDKDKAKQELVDEEEKVLLVIKAQQCTSNGDVLSLLDRTRLLIDWSSEPDNYLLVSSVSVGVPRIQRVPTHNIKDQQNGLIIDQLANLSAGLDYFLDSLKNWNRALTYDVQVLNAHSSEQLIDKWDHAWEKFFGGEHA